MHDPVITSAAPANSTTSAKVAPEKALTASVQAAPAARKRAARAPRAQALVVVPEVTAPVEAAPKPAPVAKKVAVRKPVKAAEKAQPAPPVEAAKTMPTAIKQKLVRDSFTFPENEYAQIEALKHKALALAHHAKKSEVLRAGIAALSAMSDEALVGALKAVSPLKTGRPKSGKKR